MFLLDSRGLGVSNQKVTINAPPNLTLLQIQALTDESGKAIIDSSSTIATIYNISATTNEQLLPQKLKITFY